MNIKPVKTALIKPGENIFEVFTESVKKLKEGSVIVISSKIVALQQNRIINAKDFRKMLQKEAKYVSKKETAKHIHLTFTNGILIPNAGIDFSNIEKGKAILWPKNSHKAAEEFMKKTKHHYKIKHLGVLIIDSRCQMAREGTTAITLGCAGIEAVSDERKKKDLFGNKLNVTKIAVADSLATAAHIVMGESKERTPFAIIENAPVKFANRSERLTISPKKCLFRELYPKKLL
ncbi:MAG: coenzyme F420-0:L-glutamate ligase [Patescibacteria group bacterium]|nr:coenzyme F420-0:L-glutamate ligase [Patescibacteria group bacterium]